MPGAAAAGLLLAFRAPAGPLELDGYRLVDLTHANNAETASWPAQPAHFKLEQLLYGDTPDGFVYSANRFSLPEHGGTYLDALSHFARDRQTTIHPAPRKR